MMKRIQKTSLSQSNGLSKLKNGLTKRAFKLASGEVVYGEHTITPYEKLDSDLSVHLLNPRIQKDLTEDSVKDLSSVAQTGINENGITIYNPKTGKSEIIEGSRRYYCAHLYKTDFPHWKIISDKELSGNDINYLINSLSAKKRLSYRERGNDFPRIMKENNFKKVSELAEFVKLNEETTRKLYNAASIDEKLIHIFPDCHGIPNTYYATLIKIEKTIKKHKGNLSEFIEEALSRVKLSQEATVNEYQNAIKNALTDLEKERYSKTVEEAILRDIVDFDDVNKTAKIKIDKKKRKAEFELRRFDSDLVQEIENLIKNYYEKSGK